MTGRFFAGTCCLINLAGQVLESGYAVLRVGMGREPIVKTPAGKRIDDKQGRGRRRFLSGLVRNAVREVLNLSKR